MSIHSKFRSPEENADAPLTEKIDIYSLGNVFYTLLTGAIVWEDTQIQERNRRIIEGNTLPFPEYVNKSHSFRILAKVIVDCWTLDADERPSIFDVVKYLEDAVTSLKKNANALNARQFDRVKRRTIDHSFPPVSFEQLPHYATNR